MVGHLSMRGEERPSLKDKCVVSGGRPQDTPAGMPSQRGADVEREDVPIF